ncbi:hypothetical protein E2C01_019028 [Portunus trituberculatus]|uniref:Uncharacterized protein n=1 Tax=Portunus trituberculatus TaxID=210409 RepID=A0A5B7DX65_PORTR|nr:hypothetical protein [Portunus trituberculatus]
MGVAWARPRPRLAGAADEGRVLPGIFPRKYKQIKFHISAPRVTSDGKQCAIVATEARVWRPLPGSPQRLRQGGKIGEFRICPHFPLLQRFLLYK